MSEIKDNLEAEFERICIFYSNMPILYIGISGTVFAIFICIQEFLSLSVALTWLFAFFISLMPRLIIAANFRRKLNKREITPYNISPWERYYIWNTVLPSICFISVIFFPYQENMVVVILYYAVVIIACCAATIITASTSRPVFMLFINITLLPLIAKCFFEQETILVFLGGVIIFAYFVLMHLSRKQNKLLIETIALKIESKNQSLEDPLTKLPNRRRLSLYISKLIPISRRSGDPLSIIMLDIDHFKEYNDTHGHVAGDDLLIQTSRIIEKCSRDQDLVVRYGGEEFLVVSPDTNIEQAKVIAERICKTIKENSSVTISAGVAVFDDKMDFNQLVQDADKALYKAKEGGRDRFVVSSAH